MSHDFKRKEPSKTEKILYELMMNQQGMERALWSNSSVTMALAMQLKIKPEELAEILVEKDQDMKDYSKKVNEAIRALEDKKKPAASEEKLPETTESHENHNHV